jgi:uncharacterized membrane protein (UPF0127 family)
MTGCRPYDRTASAVSASGWLLSDGRVLSSLDVARTRAERRKGLLGRDGFDGALLLVGCRWVHTFGMRFPLDVAHLDHAGVVLRLSRLPPNRVGLPVLQARQVVEAEAGAFTRWNLKVGDTLEVRTS